MFEHFNIEAERCPFVIHAGDVYISVPGLGYQRLFKAQKNEKFLDRGRFEKYRSYPSRDFIVQRPGSELDIGLLAEQIEWVADLGCEWHLEYPMRSVWKTSNRSLRFVTYMWLENDQFALHHKLRWL